MSVPDDREGLRFACECVSGRRGGYSDPWAAIAKNKLLPDGTKEEILNLLTREPKTISQLAEELRLSSPSVFAHISDMMKSELLRESEEWESGIRPNGITSRTFLSLNLKIRPSSTRCAEKWQSA